MIRENRIENTKEKAFRMPSKAVVIEQTVMIFIGALLGCAEIMGVVDVGGLAWTAVLFMWGRSAAFGFAGVLVGRVLSVSGEAIFTQCCMYIGAYVLMLLISKVYRKSFKGIYVVACMVFYILAQAALVLTETVTLYNALYIILNALALIGFSYFFYHVAGLFFKGGIFTLGQNDAVCLTVFVGLTVAGLGGLKPFGVSVGNIISLAAILICANVFGAATGTLVGTVFGIIVGLCTNIDFFTVSAFVLCGAVSGSLKNLNKISVSLAIAGMYLALFVLIGSNPNNILMVEMGVAFVLFCAIPTGNITYATTVLADVLCTDRLPTHAMSYGDRVKLACCDRIEQVCSSSAKMHRILQGYLIDTEKANREQFDALIDRITQTVCCHCTMGSSCAFANNNKGKRNPTCEVAKLAAGLNQIGNNWRSKMVTYRKIPGIAVGCMSESITRIKRSLENSVSTDSFLSETLQAECTMLCKYVSGVAAVNSEYGLEIIIDLKTSSLTMPEIDRLMKKCTETAGTDLELRQSNGTRLCFAEKSRYKLSTGVASASLDSDGLCGDSCTIVPFGREGFMLAVVDGCGTGYRALAESNKVMELLETMSQCGCDENSTVSLANALMGLRSDDDKYSTADICVFNKYTGNTKFIKMGAVCSFILQKNCVTKVECGAGPLGIQQEASAIVRNYRLKTDDVIIMMTDGVYDACGRYCEPDDYFADLLKDYKVTNAQETAEYIMQNALKNLKRQKDDMLVFTAIVGKR